MKTSEIPNIFKYTVMLILLLGTVAFTVYSVQGRSSDIADRDTVRSWISNNALIIDVRTPGEFNSGNYKGSINIPLNELSASLNKIGPKDRPIVVYCRSGNRSGMAKMILESNGFNKVINGGGLNDMPR